MCHYRVSYVYWTFACGVVQWIVMNRLDHGQLVTVMVILTVNLLTNRHSAASQVSTHTLYHAH